VKLSGFKTGKKKMRAGLLADVGLLPDTQKRSRVGLLPDVQYAFFIFL
jgi:hypothetical protein